MSFVVNKNKAHDKSNFFVSRIETAMTILFSVVSIFVFVFLGSLLLNKVEAQTTWQPPAGSPLANKEHPRIFFTSKSKQDIITKIKTYYKTDYQNFVNTLDADFSKSFSDYSDDNLGINAVRNYAFLCQVDPSSIGVSSSKNRTDYCSKSVSLAKQMASALPNYRDSIHCAQTWDGKSCGLFNVSLAVAYDWAYNDMTQADRNSLKSSLEASFDRCNDDCQGKRPLIMNVATTAALHGAFPFLALYGDGSAREAEMTAWFKDNFLDAMLAVSDVLFEGSAYHHEGDSYSLDVVLPIVMMSSAASPALGEDLFAKHKYLQELPDYFYYTIIPQKTPYGDGYAGERNNTHRYGAVWMPDETQYITLNAVASELNDIDKNQAGFAKWLADGPSPYALGGIENVKRYDKRRYDLFNKFIWGTKQVTVMSADQAGKSLMKNLGGQMVMRSDHNSESATKVVFHAYDWFYASSHDDTEQGAIGIWKYGPLIIDSVGNSKNSSNMRRWDTNKGPALNSLIGVFKAGETDKDGYNLMEFDISWPKANISNDPSQYYEGGPMDRGDKKYSSKSGVYDYVDYDYSKMYKNKASLARRQFVYLRGEENKEYVVLYDQINSSREKRALFHSGVDWKAVGGSWTSAGGGFSKLSGTSIVKIDNSTLPSGQGALFLNVLSPDATVYKIGGSSYPLVDAEGRNLSYAGSGDFEYECFSIGCWRIQVRTQGDKLLTAMQIGKSSTIGNTMTTTLRIDAGDSEGVLIGDKVVMFAKQPNTQISSIGYTVNSSGSVTHIITNTKPNTQFTVSINGVDKNVVSDKAGVLMFSDSQIGSRTVSIGGATPPPSDTTPPVVSKFDSNPKQTQDTTTVSWTATDETELSYIEIWRSKDNGTSCSNTDKSGCVWERIMQKTVSGTTNTGTYTDNPPVGTYWYGLHAIDSSGNIGYEPAPVRVVKDLPQTNTPPKAVASADPRSGDKPLTVNFDGSQSYDSDGSVVSYKWDFGNGEFSNQQNPVYTYMNSGRYNVTLTVTDDKGATDVATLDIVVNDTVTFPDNGDTALYVDNNTTQSGDGSIDSPYKTIQEALDSLSTSNNTTIYIRGNLQGSYRVYSENISIPVSGSANKKYTLSSYNKEKVLISTNSPIRFNKDYWTVKDIKFDHNNTASDAFKVSGSNLVFDNIILTNGSRDGFDISSRSTNITIKNSKIYNFVWKPGFDAHCIVVNNGMTSLLIENNTIYDCGGDGVQLFATSSDSPDTYSKGITISNNTFYTTLGANSENAIDIKGAIGLTITGNNIYDFNNKAIVIQKGPQDVKITYNKIYNSDRGIEVRGEGGHSPLNIDIINNLIYDIYGQYALKFDDVENLKVQHNTVVGVSGNPIRIEGGGVISGYIQNNITSDTGANRVLGPNNALVSYNGWFNGSIAGPLQSSTDVVDSFASFVDENNRNLKIRKDSPVIDRGITLSHISDDYERMNRPSGDGADMGAYEYQFTQNTSRPEVYINTKVDKTEAYVGDVLTYTIQYNNPSAVNAVDTVITNPVPTGTEVIESSISKGGVYLYAENMVRWNVGVIEAGTSGLVSFQVKVIDENSGSGSTGPVCGDNVCSTGETENSCPADCRQVKPSDTTPPVVSKFDSNPKQTQDTTTVSWTATDETELSYIEIWRSKDNGTSCSNTDKSGCVWERIMQKTVSGTTNTGTYTDNPPVGTYWYGLHAIDSSGNIGYEPAPVRVVKTIDTGGGDGGTTPPLPKDPVPVSGVCPAPEQRAGLVVIKGMDIPQLYGKGIDTIVGYKYDNGWVPALLQVDEMREAISPMKGLVYVTPSSASDAIPENDWIAKDTQVGFDDNDEIVIPISELGNRAPITAKNPNNVTSPRYELAWDDLYTGQKKYFYIFTSNNPQIVDKDMVDYRDDIYSCNGYPATCENTIVETACYSTRFSLRMVQDEFRIKPEAGGDNTDIIDRWKGRAYAPSASEPFVANIGENEDHKMNGKVYCGGWSVYDSEHYYLGHKDGRVRAIRQVKGACSFPNLIKIWKFAQDSVEETLVLQGHGFGEASGGLGMYWDYSVNATPITYYSEAFPQGIVFDGNPDFGSTVNISEITPLMRQSGIWSQVSSASGGVLSYAKQTVEFPNPDQNTMMLYMNDNSNWNDGTGEEPGIIGGQGFRFLTVEGTDAPGIPSPVFETFMKPIPANSSNIGAEFAQMMKQKPVVTITEVK